MKQFQAIFPEGQSKPDLRLPKELQSEMWKREKALIEVVRSRLEGEGPVTQFALAQTLSLSEFEIETALLALESEGFVFRGNYTEGETEIEWCERRLLARINRYSVEKLRKEIEPVGVMDYMRFLFSWQHINPEERMEGSDALQEIILQLEGFEAPAAAWESSILTARMHDYDPAWLDALCLSGRVLWGRFRPVAKKEKQKGLSPIKTSPIVLTGRAGLKDLNLLAQSTDEEIVLNHHANQVLNYLKENGASFFDDLVNGTDMLNNQLEQALAELVAVGAVTSDSFTGLRALLVPSRLRSTSGRRRKKAAFGMEHAGRWSLINSLKPKSVLEKKKQSSGENMIEKTANLLLKRYGIVFRKILAMETYLPPWRELVRVYRRMEAQGKIRGGRFVASVTGEQFALPEALARLRTTRKQPSKGVFITLSAVDPLNLQGIILPGRKVVANYKNRVLYRDGEPIAIYESGEVQFLKTFDEAEQWQLQKMLIQREFPAALRAYLGHYV